MKEDAVWIIMFKLSGKGKWLKQHLAYHTEHSAGSVVDNFRKIHPNNKYKIRKYVADDKWKVGG